MWRKTWIKTWRERKRWSSIFKSNFIRTHNSEYCVHMDISLSFFLTPPPLFLSIRLPIHNSSIYLSVYLPIYSSSLLLNLSMYLSIHHTFLLNLSYGAVYVVISEIEYLFLYINNHYWFRQYLIPFRWLFYYYQLSGTQTKGSGSGSLQITLGSWTAAL